MIRPAQAEDTAQIQAIQSLCFDAPWSRAMLEGALEHPRGLMRVAHANTELVGYSIAVCAADECELLSIGVHPDNQRKGIATRLCADLASEAAQKGALTIFLEVRESNKAARAFYGVMGYEVISRRERYYHNGEDAMIMRFDMNNQRGSERNG